MIKEETYADFTTEEVVLRDRSFEIDESRDVLGVDFYRNEYKIRPKMAETPSDSVNIQKLLKWLLEKGILIPNQEEVWSYLISWPDIYYIIPEICSAFRNLFSSPSQLTLELFYDPETSANHLTLYIRQQQYEEGIMKKIRKGRAQFHEDMRYLKGDIHVTTDFQPPK